MEENCDRKGGAKQLIPCVVVWFWGIGRVEDWCLAPHQQPLTNVLHLSQWHHKNSWYPQACTGRHEPSAGVPRSTAQPYQEERRRKEEERFWMVIKTYTLICIGGSWGNISIYYFLFTYIKFCLLYICLSSTVLRVNSYKSFENYGIARFPLILVCFPFFGSFMLIIFIKSLLYYLRQSLYTSPTLVIQVKFLFVWPVSWGYWLSAAFVQYAVKINMRKKGLQSDSLQCIWMQDNTLISVTE